MINKPTVLYTKFHNQPQPLIFTVHDLITAHSFTEEDMQALNTDRLGMFKKKKNALLVASNVHAYFSLHFCFKTIAEDRTPSPSHGFIKDV